MAVLSRLRAQAEVLRESLSAKGVPTAGADDPPSDAVRLLTLHASKGLEFRRVFLSGMNDGLVPLSRRRTPAEDAEERRLLFVGMTRASDAVEISYHAQPHEAGVAGEISPYLTFIPAALLDWQSASPLREAALDRGGPSPGPRACGRNRGRDGGWTGLPPRSGGAPRALRGRGRRASRGGDRGVRFRQARGEDLPAGALSAHGGVSGARATKGSAAAGAPSLASRYVLAETPVRSTACKRGRRVNSRFQISQAVLGAILESPRDIVIFALDREYRYLAYNQNHARTMKLIWGVDIEVGLSMLSVIGREDDRQKARRNFDRALAGESFTLREEYGDERIQRRVYEDVYGPIRAEDGTIMGLTVYLTDITEQKAAELELENYRTRLEDLVRRRTTELEAAHAQLLYAQKLESLGVLAGGVAHDFNNLLAVILSRAELAGPSLRPEHPARAHFEIIRETALEARMLTKQLLAYSGQGRFMIQAVDPTAMIESMASLLRASIPDTRKLTFDFCPSRLVVQLDVTQARQVLLNLVTNAAEAIEGEGNIVVRTRLVDADERLLGQACIQSDVGPGRYAAIEVEDTGCGMDREVRTRLFDPFFTTKVAGRGLGLAAVLGIVKTHRGALLLRSAPQEGSTFTVLLPIAGGPV